MNNDIGFYKSLVVYAKIYKLNKFFMVGGFNHEVQQLIKGTADNMDTTRTKNELIQWIENLNDESIISGLNAIKKSNKPGDWWNDISEVEEQEINKRLDDARAGRVISNEAFWGKHAERL